MWNRAHFQQPVSHLQFARGLCYSSWGDGLDKDPSLPSNNRETQASWVRLLQVQFKHLLLRIQQKTCHHLESTLAENQLVVKQL